MWQLPPTPQSLTLRKGCKRPSEDCFTKNLKGIPSVVAAVPTLRDLAAITPQAEQKDFSDFSVVVFVMSNGGGFRSKNHQGNRLIGMDIIHLKVDVMRERLRKTLIVDR